MVCTMPCGNTGGVPSIFGLLNCVQILMMLKEEDDVGVKNVVKVIMDSQSAVTIRAVRES